MRGLRTHEGDKFEAFLHLYSRKQQRDTRCFSWTAEKVMSFSEKTRIFEAGLSLKIKQTDSNLHGKTI